MVVVIIIEWFFGRLVSGDYRGFVMIWEVEDVKEELVSLERRLKNLPKDRRCLSPFSLQFLFYHRHSLTIL